MSRIRQASRLLEVYRPEQLPKLFPEVFAFTDRLIILKTGFLDPIAVNKLLTFDTKSERPVVSDYCEDKIINEGLAVQKIKSYRTRVPRKQGLANGPKARRRRKKWKLIS